MRIDKAIEGLGFTTAHWDEEYALYLRRKRQVENEQVRQVVTPDLNRIRRNRAKEIVEKILAAERKEDNK